MIQAESDAQKRDEYLQKLMVLPNQVICLHEKLQYFLYLFNVFFMEAKCYNARDPTHFLLQRWMEIIGKAHQNADFLKDQDVIRNVLNILQV